MIRPSLRRKMNIVYMLSLAFYCILISLVGFVLNDKTILISIIGIIGGFIIMFITYQLYIKRLQE